MKDPLPWDTIPSARFVKEDRVQPVVDALRAKSAQRVATENGFTWIHSEIAFRDQSRATKSVSLNELERREEKEQLKARQKVRQRELAELDGQLPHTYEITLKNAETPGLPPPLTRKPPQADAAESADDDASFGSDRDVIMNEAQCILSDYVGMESAPAGEVVSAGKVVSASSQLPEEIRKLGRWVELGELHFGAGACRLNLLRDINPYDWSFEPGPVELNVLCPANEGKAPAQVGRSINPL